MRIHILPLPRTTRSRSARAVSFLLRKGEILVEGLRIFPSVDGTEWRWRDLGGVATGAFANRFRTFLATLVRRIRTRAFRRTRENFLLRAMDRAPAMARGQSICRKPGGRANGRHPFRH